MMCRFQRVTFIVQFMEQRARWQNSSLWSIELAIQLIDEVIFIRANCLHIYYHLLGFHDADRNLKLMFTDEREHKIKIEMEEVRLSLGSSG